MTTKTRVYCIRPYSGSLALIRAASPAAAVRHWADSMIDVVRSASQDDLIAAMRQGCEVEVAGEDAAT